MSALRLALPCANLNSKDMNTVDSTCYIKRIRNENVVKIVNGNGSCKNVTWKRNENESYKGWHA